MRYFSTALNTEYNRNGIIVQVQNYDCINSEQNGQNNPDQNVFCHPLKNKQTNKQASKQRWQQVKATHKIQLLIKTYRTQLLLCGCTLLQAVSPGFVTTAMSGFKRPRWWVPDPMTYTRSAVATIGIQKHTYGCLAHEFQVN